MTDALSPVLERLRTLTYPEAIALARTPATDDTIGRIYLEAQEVLTPAELSACYEAMAAAAKVAIHADQDAMCGPVSAHTDPALWPWLDSRAPVWAEALTKLLTLGYAAASGADPGNLRLSLPN